MTRPVTLIQKIAGLAALVTAAAMIAGPILAGLSGIATKESLLLEKRAALAALEDRVIADRQALQRDAQSYERLRQSFDAQTVSQSLGASCSALAERFANAVVMQNCSMSQLPAGGELQLHAALLSATGPIGELLQALDDLPATNPSADQLRVFVDPGNPGTATMTVRLTDVSDLPPDAQP